jgi:hypothetical protein
MTSMEFCYWLQGFFELSDGDARIPDDLTGEQVTAIREHLALVFEKVTGGEALAPPKTASAEKLYTGDEIMKMVEELMRKGSAPKFPEVAHFPDASAMPGEPKKFC